MTRSPLRSACLKADVAAVLVDGGVNHRCRGAVPRQLVEELGRFFARFRAGEFPLDGEDIFAEPREQLGLAARDGGVLRQVGVTIDQARENGDAAAVAPLRLYAALGAPQRIVVADRCDPSALDNDRAVAPGAEGAEFRGVDDEPADAKQVVHRRRCEAGQQSDESVATLDFADVLRRRCGNALTERLGYSAESELPGGFPGRETGTKKIRAAHARRNNKYEKRAAARIALTCYIRQRSAAVVQLF
jgi:hypothetical protein